MITTTEQLDDVRMFDPTENMSFCFEFGNGHGRSDTIGFDEFDNYRTTLPKGCIDVTRGAIYTMFHVRKRIPRNIIRCIGIGTNRKTF